MIGCEDVILEVGGEVGDSSGEEKGSENSGIDDADDAPPRPPPAPVGAMGLVYLGDSDIYPIGRITRKDGDVRNVFTKCYHKDHKGCSWAACPARHPEHRPNDGDCMEWLLAGLDCRNRDDHMKGIPSEFVSL